MNKIEVINTKKIDILKYLEEGIIILSGAFIISLSAFLTFYLPFALVPITLQCHVALFIAFALGKIKGPFSVLTFLVMGAFGLNVFGSGKIGYLALIGPTGGYLWGYLAASIIIVRFKPVGLFQTFLVLSFGNIIIYLWGASYLSLFIGYSDAFKFGILPFLGIDFIKLALFSRLATFRKIDSAIKGLCFKK